MRKLIEKLGCVCEGNVQEETSDELDSIKFSEIEKHISKLLGISVNIIHFDVQKNNSAGGTGFQSGNLINNCGIMKSVFSKVFVKGVYYTKALPADIAAAVSVDLRWEHKSGGGNGADLFRAGLELDGKWKFRDLQ